VPGGNGGIFHVERSEGDDVCGWRDDKGKEDVIDGQVDTGLRVRGSAAISSLLCSYLSRGWYLLPTGSLSSCKNEIFGWGVGKRVGDDVRPGKECVGPLN